MSEARRVWRLFRGMPPKPTGEYVDAGDAPRGEGADAERIARLLNGGPSKEARDAALISPILYAAITRWQGGAPWVVEVEKAAVILAGQLDASHKYSAELLATRPSTDGVDLTTYLAYEAGTRDADGWREARDRADQLEAAVRSLAASFRPESDDDFRVLDIADALLAQIDQARGEASDAD